MSSGKLRFGVARTFLKSD